MDFVDGTDAASLLRDRYPAGVPADDVATIIAAIASALDYAHQRDLLHPTSSPRISCSPTLTPTGSVKHGGDEVCELLHGVS